MFQDFFLEVELAEVSILIRILPVKRATQSILSVGLSGGFLILNIVLDHMRWKNSIFVIFFGETIR